MSYVYWRRFVYVLCLKPSFHSFPFLPLIYPPFTLHSSVLHCPDRSSLKEVGWDKGQGIHSNLGTGQVLRLKCKLEQSQSFLWPSVILLLPVAKWPQASHGFSVLLFSGALTVPACSFNFPQTSIKFPPITNSSSVKSIESTIFFWQRTWLLHYPGNTFKRESSLKNNVIKTKK